MWPNKARSNRRSRATLARPLLQGPLTATLTNQFNASREEDYARIELLASSPVPGGMNLTPPPNWSYAGLPCRQVTTGDQTGPTTTTLIVYFDAPSSGDTYPLRLPTAPEVLTVEGGLFGPVDVDVEYEA